VQAEPAEIFHGGGGKLGAAAVAVDVVYAQQELASRRSGPLGGHRKGAGVATVQVARGRGREAANVRGNIGWGFFDWKFFVFLIEGNLGI